MKDIFQQNKIGWFNEYSSKDMIWPNEMLIRIFSKPDRFFEKKNIILKNKKILDVGCGDIGNLFFLSTKKMKIYGVEIEKKIVDKVSNFFKKKKIKSNIAVGQNKKIPFKNNFFDFVISWNSIYYMNDKDQFEDHVKEFARVIKKGGYLIMSIPDKKHLIFKNSKIFILNKKKYARILKDPLEIRNGQTFKYFDSQKSIKKEFSNFFKNFFFAQYQFEYNHNYAKWNVIICKKK